jgi:hypothetical protein
MMGTMVPFSDNAVEVGDEVLRPGAERAAEVNQYRQRRVPRTSLDLREVLEADARALCDVRLRQSEPASHLAHTPTQHEAYSPVARVVRHCQIVRRSPLVTPARYPSINSRENA